MNNQLNYNNLYDLPWLFFQVGNYSSCLAEAYKTGNTELISFFEYYVSINSSSLNSAFLTY